MMDKIFGPRLPMLCEKATVEEARAIVERFQGEYVVQQKVDGVRGIIRNGKLYDRRGKDITQQFPEFVGIEKVEGELDGEIICTSNEFGDVAGRMHVKDAFARKILMKRNPAIFVLFDVVSEKPLYDRIAELKRLAAGGRLPSWVRPLRTDVLCGVDHFNELWDEVLALGREGLVMKRPESLYVGKRSSDWLKVKAFEETTAIFIKAEHHPRGVRLETADGRAVNVNGSQAAEVVALLERNGQVCCEVQYMRSPAEGSTAWRFPSFRGVAK